VRYKSIIAFLLALFSWSNAFAVAVYDAAVNASVIQTNTLIPQSAQTIIQGLDRSFEQRLRERIVGVGGSDTLKGLIEKQTGYLSDLIKANTEQSAKMFTEQQEFQMNLKKAEDASAVAKNAQPSPLTCASMTTAVASTSIMSVGQSANNSVIESKHASRANRGYRRAGGVAAAVDVLTEHNKYCAKGDPTCTPDKAYLNKKAAPGAPPGSLEDADKNVKTLLSGAGNDGVDILTYTPEQVDAALAFITNVKEGSLTPRRLNQSESETPAGRIYNAKLIEYDAIKSASSYSLDSILASRMPAPSSELWVKYMMQSANGDSGEKIKDMLSKIKSHTGSDKISPADILRVEILRRSANPQWMLDIQKASSDTMLLRELVIMQALSLQMQYEKLRRDEAASVLNSMQALELVKQRMLPELRKLETSVVSN